MVSPKTETHLVRKGESPRSPDYAQRTRPRFLLPTEAALANRDLRSGLTPQLGAHLGWAVHCGAWGGRKGEQVRGLKGTDQATELAAKGG